MRKRGAVRRAGRRAQGRSVARSRASCPRAGWPCACAGAAAGEAHGAQRGEDCQGHLAAKVSVPAPLQSLTAWLDSRFPLPGCSSSGCSALPRSMPLARWLAGWRAGAPTAPRTCDFGDPAPALPGTSRGRDHLALEPASSAPLPRVPPLHPPAHEATPAAPPRYCPVLRRYFDPYAAVDYNLIDRVLEPGEEAVKAVVRAAQGYSG